MSCWFSHGFSKFSKDWDHLVYIVSPTLESLEEDLIFIMAPVQVETPHMHL